MSAASEDPSVRAFDAEVSQLYEQLVVPLLFEPYATDLAQRVDARAPRTVLEIAAGTGVVTRAMDKALAGGVHITATDLNAAMLDQASAIGTGRPIEWRTADAMALPFAAEMFDVVVCQFGSMFFPDKATAFSEARRVLRAGGTFVFNVWDRIEENEFADTVESSVAGLFPTDPPRFLSRLPHGYHDTRIVVADLEQAGFARPFDITTLAVQISTASPEGPAVAYCHGTPLRREIEARDPARLVEATEVATEAIAQRFGRGSVSGKIQAHVFSIGK